MNVAIVYHSGYGHTEVVAEHVLKGVVSLDGCRATLVRAGELPSDVDDDAWRPLHEADALVLGCPTYMGGPSAPFKAFMDASSAVWLRQGWRDKIAAGFTNGGGLDGDKGSTLGSLAVFAAQHGMIWVSLGLEPSRDVNRLGSSLGLTTQSGNAPPTEQPPTEDRRTAEMFGRRIAEATRRWSASHAPAV